MRSADLSEETRVHGSAATSHTSITLSIPRITRFLAILIAVILALGLLHTALVGLFGFAEGSYPLRLLSLDTETSLACWFSTLLLAAAGGIALLCARASNARSWVTLCWWIIGIGLLLMSVDESIAIHEDIWRIFTPDLETSGPFTFKWVVVGLPVVAMLALLFIPFLLRVQRPTAVRLLAAGATFVTGALGMEMIGGAIRFHPAAGQFYWIEVVFEEGLEMIGSLLVIRALLLHLATYHPQVRLGIAALA